MPGVSGKEPSPLTRLGRQFQVPGIERLLASRSSNNVTAGNLFRHVGAVSAALIALAVGNLRRRDIVGQGFSLSSGCQTLLPLPGLLP